MTTSFWRLEAIPAAKALQMAREGQFKDAKTIASLLLAEKYLLDM